MKLSKQTIDDFTSTVKQFYAIHGRDMPWRHLSDDLRLRFYQVFVSELMLQQTQVSRVHDKYLEWMARFPSMNDVANASLHDVLKTWQGLGYNRRAKYIYDSALRLSQTNEMSWREQLDSLPGVGVNTKGAVLAYCYNEPAVFIETNIRTVYMAHFFKDHNSVSDKEILNVATLCVDTKNPREWYWGLMDYGTHLKKTLHINHKSAHYKKQTKFGGSSRQLRAAVLRGLLEAPKTENTLQKIHPDERLQSILDALVRDGIVQKLGRTYRIAA